MQQGASDADSGVHPDTKVDDYIEADLTPTNSRGYQEFINRTQHNGKASNERKDSNARYNTEPSQVSDPYAHNDRCKGPPCWGWAVIIALFVLSATMITLLVIFLRTTSNRSTTTPDPNTVTTATGLSTSAVITPPSAPQEAVYRHCQDAYSRGQTISGVYRISPGNFFIIDVYCEQVFGGGGWTVFQRRINGSQNFYLEWEDYKRGFGSAMGEYWIGNYYLHQLTANRDTQLLVELQYGNEKAYAHYSEFWIGNEESNFRLHATDFSNVANNPGDSLTYHNGLAFSTRDRDNDPHYINCAEDRSGGWWYNECTQCNLNGIYRSNSKRGITWFSWKGSTTSLSAVRMLLKSK